MKPREMYSGAAPIAMAQMGQGLAEVGANIGRITQQGYQQMGEGIGKGMQALKQSYDEYKKTQSDIKSKEKAAGIFMAYLPEDKQIAFQNSIDAINSDEKASLQDKKAFWDTAFGVLGQAVGHANLMEKTKFHEGEATKRTGITEAGAESRNKFSQESENLRQKTQLEKQAESERFRLLYGTATDATGIGLEKNTGIRPASNFNLSPFESGVYGPR